VIITQLMSKTFVYLPLSDCYETSLHCFLNKGKLNFAMEIYTAMT